MSGSTNAVCAKVDEIRRLLKPDDAFEEEVVSCEQREENAIFRVEHMKVLQPDGTHGVREIVRHRGGVGVLALSGGRMCLVRQWRVALGRMTLEIPAGKVDLGEDERKAAARELSEETGLVARRLTLVARAAGSPGFTDEMTRIYRAWGLTQSTAHPDAGEFVDVVWAEPSSVVMAASAGIVQDAKTIIAAYAALCDGEAPYGRSALARQPPLTGMGTFPHR